MLTCEIKNHKIRFILRKEINAIVLATSRVYKSEEQQTSCQVRGNGNKPLKKNVKYLLRSTL